MATAASLIKWLRTLPPETDIKIYAAPRHVSQQAPINTLGSRVDPDGTVTEAVISTEYYGVF